MSLDMRLDQQMSVRAIRQWLASRVDPKLDEYWSSQINKGGPIPQEILDNKKKLAQFRTRQKKFGKFVGDLAARVFENENLEGKEAYVVGVGTGEDLREITAAANSRGSKVVAYDVATAGYMNALAIYGRLAGTEGIRHSKKNSVYLADIEEVLRAGIINPKSARYLFLVRLLETLNRPSNDPGKMERVCVLLGGLLRQGLKIILVGARPEDNSDVKFKNTEPVPLYNIITPMQEGSGQTVCAGKLGKFRLFQHKYAAHLIQCSGGGNS